MVLWVVPKVFKTERVKSLLKTSNYSARDIADIVGVSSRHVTGIRRALRLPSDSKTVNSRLAALEQETRDLRRMVAHLMNGRPSCRKMNSSELPRV